jgi:virulence-associated protein VapD
MPSSYQKRLDENKKLRERNKELTKQLEEMNKAIHILNKCIQNVDMIRIEYDEDLRYEYQELCKEMKEN